jgi:hypothetical protein
VNTSYDMQGIILGDGQDECLKLTRARHCKLHQMIHERLQTDIVREDCLCALTWAAIGTCSMCRAGIQLAK